MCSSQRSRTSAGEVSLVQADTTVFRDNLQAGLLTNMTSGQEIFVGRYSKLNSGSRLISWSLFRTSKLPCFVITKSAAMPKAVIICKISNVMTKNTAMFILWKCVTYLWPYFDWWIAWVPTLASNYLASHMQLLTFLVRCFVFPCAWLIIMLLPPFYFASKNMLRCWLYFSLLLLETGWQWRAFKVNLFVSSFRRFK